MGIVVLALWGIQNFFKPGEKEREEYKKFVDSRYDHYIKIYAAELKNLKREKDAFNKAIAYIETHPKVIEDLKNYDYKKLEEDFKSLIDSHENIERIFGGVKYTFEKGTIIDLCKRLISQVELLEAQLKLFPDEKRCYEVLTPHQLRMRYHFYKHLQIYISTGAMFIYTALLDLGHNPDG
jgi:hypothetical protein